MMKVETARVGDRELSAEIYVSDNVEIFLMIFYLIMSVFTSFVTQLFLLFAEFIY